MLFCPLQGLGRDLNPSFRGRVLNKELIPRHLNVTDQCQHLDVTLKRYQESPSKTEETDSAEISAKFASGQLSHQLKFQSVYPHVLHRLRGAQEVTTYQNDWVTVDYIFYKYIRVIQNCCFTFSIFSNICFSWQYRADKLVIAIVKSLRTVGRKRNGNRRRTAKFSVPFGSYASRCFLHLAL